MAEYEDVRDAGFPVSKQGGASRKIVIHRSRNGTWSVIDCENFDEVPDHLRARAITLAAAVVSGLDVVGRSVTSLELDEYVTWSGVWRAGHHRTTQRCRVGKEGCGSGQ